MTVFFDVDTQVDFLSPTGALYVPGAEEILGRVAALNRYAVSRGIRVVSTVDAHTPNDPEFRHWPPHCVAGTPGQEKAAMTLLERRITIPNSPGLPETSRAQQMLLEKQSLDCFANVNLRELLERLDAQHAVVYGVVTELCVRNAAMGLLKAGRRVELVTDAIKELDPIAAAQTIAELIHAGGTVVTADQVMSGSRGA